MASPNTIVIQYIFLFSHRAVRLPHPRPRHQRRQRSHTGHCGGFEVGYVQDKSYMMCHDVSLDLQTKVETVPAARDAHKSTGFRFTFLLPVCRFNARAAMTFRTRGWPD